MRHRFPGFSLVWALALQVGCLSLMAQAPLATPVRVADAACAKCHQQIFDEYVKTPMANASGLAAERVHAGAVQNLMSGVAYSISERNGEVDLSYKLPEDPPIVGSHSLEYFLGSGHLGLTYLYSQNHYLLESPVAYYAALSGYAMKPGYQNASEAPPALTVNPSCLRCHMSAVEKQEPGTDNLYRQLPFQHTGVTCESCHGDSLRHIASGGLVAVVDPLKLTPVRRDSVCTVCHLEGDTNVEHRGKSVLEYRPGDDLNDFITYFAYTQENTTHRAVSEVEQFLSSRCRRTSGPAMSCMSCHDPHSAPSPEQRVAFYRGKCLACHTQAKYATEHFAENPDCTSCHMPSGNAQNVPHVAWTDHRILQRPNTVNDAADTQAAGLGIEAMPSLEVLVNGTSNPREMALAYYNLVVTKGMTRLEPKAMESLMALGSFDDDEAVLRALGVLAEMNREDDRAALYYRKLLSIDPVNLAAATNLGTVLAKRGELKQAVAIWQSVFVHNQDIPELGENLANAECRLGDERSATQTLHMVLTYSPGLTRARAYLESMQGSAAVCVRAGGPAGAAQP
jgi:predicted CXXCH cytochrome family protein